MRSDDDKRSEKSGQVLHEYYTKYSQSQNLLKYFSGSSVSYLPPIVPTRDDHSPEPSLQSRAKDLIENLSGKSEIVIEENSSSDDQSFSDHRKLEWDNGADIGYDSARKNADKLQKSFSLPILDVFTEQEHAVNTVPTLVPSTVITHSNSDENIGIAVFSSSSSTSSSEQEKQKISLSSQSKDLTLENPVSSSSIQTNTERSCSKNLISGSSSSSTTDGATQLRDFQKTINFLKQKIGLPGAHSTPNTETQTGGLYKIVSKGAAKLKKTRNQGSDLKTTNKNKVVRPSEIKSNKEQFSDSSKSTPRQLCKSKVKTKVVELSISTPINVNCRSVTESPAVITQPKAVQTETVNLRHVETQFNFIPPQPDSQKQPICEDMADSASSFEYISVGTHKTGISGVLKEISVYKSTTTESSHTSRTSSEDVDKYLEVLQKLLKSKKLDSSTKRRCIKKLLKELNELDESSASSDFFIPKKDPTRSVFLLSKQSSKSKECLCGTTSSSSPVFPKVTSTAESAECKTVNDHPAFAERVHELQNRLADSLPTCQSERFTLPKPKVDFGGTLKDKTEDHLIKFAENERAYQLSWINNEISHLSKLKNILESKGNTCPRTSNYDVIQRNGGARQYVIDTDINLESSAKINYCIDGKEYIVSDSKSSSSDKVVIADIKVSSEDHRTNIKVRTICSVCKEVICVCVSSGSSAGKKEKDVQSSSGSVSQGLQSLLQLESITPQDFNSLQQIFKGCDCTTKNPSCTCGFVRKLLSKFQGRPKNTDGVNEAIQTDPSKDEGHQVDEKHQILGSLDYKNKDTWDQGTEEQFYTENRLETQGKQLQVQGMQKYGLVDLQVENDKQFHSQGMQITDSFNSENQQILNQGLELQAQTGNYQSSLETQVEIDTQPQGVQTFDLFEVGSKMHQTSDQGLGRHVQTENIQSSLESQTQINRRNVEVQIEPNKVEEQVEAVVSKGECGSQETKQTICQCVQTEEYYFAADTNHQPKDQARLESRSIQTDQHLSQADKEEPSRPTSSSSKSSNGASRVTCFCCKQKAFLAEVSYMQDGDHSMVVCSRCYYNQPRYCRHNSCRCWSYWTTNSSGKVCQCCRKCLKRPSGLMYTVTLQDREAKARQNGVGRIKVQDGWSGKSLKDKENHSRKMKKEKVNKIVEQKIDNEPQYTLTEYLIKNKPEFIYSAEHRRQMLMNSRILREQQTENVKLNFLENNEKKNFNEAKYKLFTGREMKEITKRNYKNLPEVQQKLVKQRQNRLRRADKLISNIFAKEVQKSVLKGRGNFPIDRPLTRL